MREPLRLDEGNLLQDRCPRPLYPWYARTAPPSLRGRSDQRQPSSPLPIFSFSSDLLIYRHARLFDVELQHSDRLSDLQGYQRERHEISRACLADLPVPGQSHLLPTPSYCPSHPFPLVPLAFPVQKPLPDDGRRHQDVRPPHRARSCRQRLLSLAHLPRQAAPLDRDHARGRIHGLLRLPRRAPVRNARRLHQGPIASIISSIVLATDDLESPCRLTTVSTTRSVPGRFFPRSPRSVGSS